MSISIDILDSCLSTNAELALRPDAPHGYVLATRAQTAGRGQRGNSWEAEPGKNLTFSMQLRPRGMGATRQFELSMLVALAVADTVTEILAT
ncbi:MAG: biotin--[acetyl-CoA-carboxylase] ligase, partial [Muribaculaceae bacterium]|nr:biotin--[acetyl-CoA-carboxylase] ligase [Muribaculaceae bacterium]